jgi:hypothetical protein
VKKPSNFQVNEEQRLVRALWGLDREHLEHPGWAPAGSDRWLPVKKVQPSPDDPLFSQIAGLARVPANCLAELQKCISLELEREWRWHERPIADQQEFKSARNQMGRLKDMLSELQASLSSLDSLALGSLTYAAVLIWEDENYDRQAPDPPPGGYGFTEIKNAIATLTERASKAAYLLGPEKTARPVGRPARGGFGEPIGPGSLKQFTLRFLWDIKSVGGRLTLDKNRGTGTLLDVLRLLSPHLPPGFIPDDPPLSTLSEVLALSKKLAR